MRLNASTDCYWPSTIIDSSWIPWMKQVSQRRWSRSCRRRRSRWRRPGCLRWGTRPLPRPGPASIELLLHLPPIVICWRIFKNDYNIYRPFPMPIECSLEVHLARRKKEVFPILISSLFSPAVNKMEGSNESWLLFQVLPFHDFLKLNYIYQPEMSRPEMRHLVRSWYGIRWEVCRPSDYDLTMSFWSMINPR